MNHTLGIVIPAYKPDVNALVSYVHRLHDRVEPTVILVELDASTPETRARLARTPAAVHAVDDRRGKGAAVSCGFDRLETDVLAFVDADGSTPPEALTSILSPVQRGDAALSVGSRRHPEAQVVADRPRLRGLLGDCFALLARSALDVDLYDYQCGAKALTRDTWDAVRGDLTQPGFAWDVDLIAAVDTRDRPIAEVPITWYDVPWSTVSVSTPLELGVGLARTVFRHQLGRVSVSRASPSRYVETVSSRWEGLRS